MYALVYRILSRKALLPSEARALSCTRVRLNQTSRIKQCVTAQVNSIFQLTDYIDLMFGWRVMYAPYSESTDCCQGRLCCRQSTSSGGHMCATIKLPGPCTVCYSTSQLTALQLTALRCNSIISAVVWRVSVAKTACRSCAHNKSHLCDCNCSAHVQATLPQQRKAAQCVTFTYQGCA